MRAWMIFICLVSILSSNAQYAPVGTFQLATPTIIVEETFFKRETRVRIELDVKGVIIRYALDNKVVSDQSAIYTDPLLIRKSQTITAKAYHKDFQASEQVTVSAFRLPGGHLEAFFDPDPAPAYMGKGSNSVVDLEKGSMNFRDGRWLGFSADTIFFNLNLGDVPNLGSLNLSILEDHSSWIFAPIRVEVWNGQQQIGLWEEPHPESHQPKSFQFIEVPLKEVGEQVKLKVIMDQIPEWHDGRGTTPWLFIDELFSSN